MNEGLQFFVSLCSCEDGEVLSETRPSESVTVFGETYPADYRGKIEVDYRVEDDCVKFRLPERRYNVSLGLASRMEAVLIRVRPQRTTIQALYDDIGLIVGAACCHGNGCECYAGVGCSCFVD